MCIDRNHGNNDAIEAVARSCNTHETNRKNFHFGLAWELFMIGGIEFQLTRISSAILKANRSFLGRSIDGAGKTPSG